MPSKMTKIFFQKVNCNYCGLLRQSIMVIENNMIVLCEPLGSGCDCFTKLRIVPPPFKMLYSYAFTPIPSVAISMHIGRMQDCVAATGLVVASSHVVVPGGNGHYLC